MTALLNASDSVEQRAIEKRVRDLLNLREDEFSGNLKSEQIALGSAHIQVDACDQEKRVFVEIYAGTGQIKGGQWHKIMADAFKLVALEKSLGGKACTKAICFVDPETFACFQKRPWRMAAFELLGVKCILQEIAPEDMSLLKAAKKRQGNFSAFTHR